MPSGFTTYFARKIAGHVFCGETWTPPTTYYAVPYVGEPTDLGTSNPSVLTTRQALTLAIPDATGMAMTTSDLSWVETAPEAITHFGFWDLATGGHCCYIKELDQVINYYVGDTITLPKFGIKIPSATDLSELLLAGMV